MRFIRINQAGWAAFAVAAALSIAQAAPAPTNAPGSALNLARQLNQAFIEVADQVSPAVVVIRVAQKTSNLQLDGSDNPLWDLLPPELRKQLEDYRNKIGRASCRERV